MLANNYTLPCWKATAMKAMNPGPEAEFNAFEDMSSPRKPVEGDFIQCYRFQKSAEKRHLFGQFGRVEKINKKYVTVRHYLHSGTSQMDYWKLNKQDGDVIKKLVFNDLLKSEYIEKRESNAFNL